MRCIVKYIGRGLIDRNGARARRCVGLLSRMERTRGESKNTVRIRRHNLKIVWIMLQDLDLKPTYDAIVIGSGAAGGMAAHVLTSHGLQVLMLEAGKKLPIEQELKSMQSPCKCMLWAIAAAPNAGNLPVCALEWQASTQIFLLPSVKWGFEHVMGLADFWCYAAGRKELGR